MLTIIRTPDYDALSKEAAKVLADQIKEKDNCVLGLATGSTPIGAYRSLIEMVKNEVLDVSKISCCNLDEYKGLPQNHDQSYYYFMQKNLFEGLGLVASQTHIPNGLTEDADAECKAYDELIASLGGIDTQLLGIGHNGHIGFNEPSDHYSKGTNVVDLQESTLEANKRFFASVDDVPKQAFTMGCQTIMNAKKILIIISGKEKADILEKSFFGPITPQVPASILQMHQDVILVADEAALSKVPK